MSFVKHPRNLKLGLLFLGRKRPGFDMKWGAMMEQKVREAVDRSPFDVFEPPKKAIDDTSLREVLALCEEAQVDTLLLLQTTMADGRLAPTLAQLWPHPPVLWATPEKQSGDMISSCSLVGLHAWASTLRQIGSPFEIFYGDPEDPDALEELNGAIRLAATVRRLRSARVGLIGGQAPGFFAMSADPVGIRRGLGTQVQTFSLVEFAEAVDALSDEDVAADVANVKEMGLQHKDTSDDDLPMASRLYLAMRRFMDEEAIDALSVRCWPEMPNLFGQWPYLGMARLAEETRAIACEGDADGALSALVGESLRMGRCFLTDWLEHDDETITLWHGGAAPPSLAAPPGEPGAPRIARHFNIRKPAVLEAEIRRDIPVTIFRLWRCDGEYRISACEARTVKPRRRLMGTNALVRLSDRRPREWFEELCYEGMPHHLVVFQGSHVNVLRRFARLSGIRWIA